MVARALTGEEVRGECADFLLEMADTFHPRDRLPGVAAVLAALGAAVLAGAEEEMAAYLKPWVVALGHRHGFRPDGPTPRRPRR